MSPVEIWGMLYFWQMKAACVPLPAPGAPSKISLMVSSDGSWILCRTKRRPQGWARRSCFEDSTRAREEFPLPGRLQSVSGGGRGGKDGTHARQIFGRVDARSGGDMAHMHRDAMAVP